MWMLREFATVLASRLQIALPPIGCSRVEFALDDNNTLMVLFRTKPELSARMLASSSYQYPLELVANATSLYEKLLDYLNAGEVVLSVSELMAIARRGARQGDLPGAHPDDRGMLCVPEADLLSDFDEQNASYGSTTHWTAILLEAAGILHGKPEAQLELQVAYLPDTPADELTHEQLQRLHSLAVGWNYLRIFKQMGHGYAGPEVLLMAAELAEVVVEYP